VLLSDSGNALVIDFGYDFSTGMPSGEDRASRRPWLRSLKALKAQFGVEKIEVAIPTHPHDDHVAGFNLLRRVEGTEIWAAQVAAPILADPRRYNLPCMWYDPIPVDRMLPFSQVVRWQEYELTLHPLPGHSAYAAAIEFRVDGRRVLATGDQYQSGEGTLLNYVYPNRFAHEDFCSSAALIRRLNPDLLLTGHWGAQVLTGKYLQLLEERGGEFAQLHNELLAEEIQGWGAEGFGACIEPYRVDAQPGECIEYTVEITNPRMQPAEVELRIVAPGQWRAYPGEHRSKMDAAGRTLVTFDLIVSPEAAPDLVAIAVEMDVDGRPFGQQAEALVQVARRASG
jgi:glyoxylase-like metal-dependent hydrolase (beta-lactamase superfamily II)